MKAGLLAVTGLILASVAWEGVSAVPGKDSQAVTADIGGVGISLPAEWKLVSHTSNAAVCLAARHPGLNIEMAATRFNTDLSLTQCAAVMAAALITTNVATKRDQIAKRVKLPGSEIEKVIASPTGRTLAKQVRATRAGYELRDLFFQNVRRGEELERQFDIQSEVASKGLYRRDFLIRSSASNEIVQITYTGPSKAVLTNSAIIKSVRPPAP